MPPRQGWPAGGGRAPRYQRQSQPLVGDDDCMLEHETGLGTIESHDLLGSNAPETTELFVRCVKSWCSDRAIHEGPILDHVRQQPAGIGGGQ